MISHLSGGLPYAIVPNGGGSTPSGTPAGNNPSGSPLGPVNQNGNGAPGTYTITSWTSYLSQAFGAGVNPAYRGSVTSIYPFSFSSTVRGNQVINIAGGSGSNIRGGGDGGRGGAGGNGYDNWNWAGSGSGSGSGGCGGNGPTTSTTGTITAVRQDSFDLRGDDGAFYTINIAPCTLLAQIDLHIQLLLEMSRLSEEPLKLKVSSQVKTFFALLDLGTFIHFNYKHF